MNENLNLVEILKDCPKGTKLYSPIFGEVEFVRICQNDSVDFPIEFKLSDNSLDSVTTDGRLYEEFNGECILFPSKDQRDWEKFKAPWYKKDKLVEPTFKVGDWIITPTNKVLQITSIEGTSYRFNNESHYWEICYCDEECRLWTIQYAKDGDVIFYDDGWICIFKCIHGIWYSSYFFITDDGEFHTGYERHTVDSTIHGNAHPATKEQRDILMKAMNNAGYKWNAETKTLEKLVEQKFDPKTLKPYDKVLVRDGYSQCWKCNLFSHTETEYPMFPYTTHVGHFYYCIPYNDDTKHLVGTTEEAPEFYRYWED